MRLKLFRYLDYNKYGYLLFLSLLLLVIFMACSNPPQAEEPVVIETVEAVDVDTVEQVVEPDTAK